jgi:hypothetical protein
VKKPQWITLGAAIFLVAIIYFFGRTTPLKETTSSTNGQVNSGTTTDLTDTILKLAKSQVTAEQVIRLNTLENSISVM